MKRYRIKKRYNGYNFYYIIQERHHIFFWKTRRHEVRMGGKVMMSPIKYNSNQVIDVANMLEACYG